MMSTATMDTYARRVVSGLNAEGKSVIMVDEISPVRMALPAFVANDVWRAETLPTTFEADALGTTLELDPPPGGITVRLVTFVPDSWIDREGYDKTIEQFHGADYKASGGGLAIGMHKMTTVDVDTVISGELWCVFDSGEETLLKQGDTIINRGTVHAWSNRTDQPATVVAVVCPVALSGA